MLLVLHLIHDFHLFSVGQLHRVRLNSLLNEIFGHLLGDLSKDSFGQFDWVRFKLSEWNKLDNVSGLVHSMSVRVQWCIVSIKLLHAREVSITHADNDYRERKARCSYN